MRLVIRMQAKDGIQDLDQMPVNVALVLRADDLEGAKALAQVEALLDEFSSVRAVYRNHSVDRLWMHRGGEGPG